MHYVAVKLTHQEEINLGMHFEDLFKIKMEKKNSSGLAKLFLRLINHQAMKIFAGMGSTLLRGRFRRKGSWPTLSIRNKEEGHNI